MLPLSSTALRGLSVRIRAGMSLAWRKRQPRPAGHYFLMFVDHLFLANFFLFLIIVDSSNNYLIIRQSAYGTASTSASAKCAPTPASAPPASAASSARAADARSVLAHSPTAALPS